MQVSLDLNQWKYIGAVLSERPYREVAVLIGDIERQLNEPPAVATGAPAPTDKEDVSS